MCYTIALKLWDEFNANFVLLYFSSKNVIIAQKKCDTFFSCGEKQMWRKTIR